MSRAVIASNISVKISGGGSGASSITTGPNEYADVYIGSTPATVTINGIAFLSTTAINKFKVPPSSTASTPANSSYVLFRNSP